MMFKRVLPILALAGLVLSACGVVSPASQDRPQLMTSGTGVVHTQPDIAYINLGVTIQDNDVAQAVAANNLRAQAVAKAARDLGVADADIRTSYFSVSPQPQFDSSGAPTGQTVYWVSNTILITLRKIDQMGTLLQAAVNAGANNINGISFDVADKTQAQQQARELAMRDALSHAMLLADAAGVKLGEVLTVSSSQYSPVPGPVAGGASSAGVSSGGNVPIAPGTFDVQVDVTVTYALR